MTFIPTRDPSRIEELLIDQATSGLDDNQLREMDELLAANPDLESNNFVQVAALVQLALLDRDKKENAHLAEKMPGHLREKIRAWAASAHLAKPTSKVAHISPSHKARKNNLMAERLRFRDLGWAVAAMLVVAVVYLQPAAEISSPGEMRQALIAESQDAVTVEWLPSEQSGYENVAGDVVWSDSTQTGFMRLSGLPANNPDQAQYQLWIIDPERSAQPVDGGVFDISPGSNEVVVAIDPKLRVNSPTTFAITLEKPGGVVVSAGPLLVVASAG